MNLPLGLILMVLCLVSLIWGIACAVIGGIVRFNLVQYVNQYISDLDTKNYVSISDGMISLKESYTEADLGSAPRTIGIMAIIVGILVIIYSLVGLAAGMLKNMSMLFVLIGCILVSTMLQFVTIWMIIDVNSSFHDSAKADLGDKLRAEYRLGRSAPQWSMVMNSIMLAGHCCGVRGPQDFSNMTYRYSSGLDQTLLVSPACCKAEAWARGYDSLLDCGSAANSMIHTEGCYNAVFNDAYDSDLFSYMMLIFVITIWQCIAMAVGVLMLFNPPDEEGGKAAGSRLGGPGAGADQGGEAGGAADSEMKTFTPFSKISSYQDADINRIKSTEIW